MKKSLNYSKYIFAILVLVLMSEACSKKSGCYFSATKLEEYDRIWTTNNGPDGNIPESLSDECLMVCN